MANSFSKQTKEKVLQVVGKRGQYVLQFMPELQYTTVGASGSIWDEGTLQERKVLLKQKLDASANDAIALLESTWHQEPIVNKRAFLEIIASSVDAEVISFLNRLYETEFVANAKERKTEKECRSVLAHCIIRSAENQLYIATKSQLQTYLNIEKKGLLGFVSGKKTADFVLPLQFDSIFWNVETMNLLYGFETKNYDAAIFENIIQYWLYCLIEICPMQIWFEIGFSSYTDLFSCFLDKEVFQYKQSGKQRSMFLSAFQSNAITHCNSSLASCLLSRCSVNEVFSLLPLLSISEYELYVKKNNYFDEVAVLENNPCKDGQTWSVLFSEYILSQLADQFIKNPNQSYRLQSIGLVVAQFVHPSSISLLEKLSREISISENQAVWNTMIYEPIISIYKIKSLLTTIQK